MCDSPWTGCAWRTTPIYMWCEQAIIEWLLRMISIVACCHSVKLCVLTAYTFWSQQNSAMTRMWRPYQVQPSQTEPVISAARCKKEGMLLQPLCWCCIKCAIHHERDVSEEQHPYMARTSNNRVIVAHDVYCCLLPQCEALRTCCSGLLITTAACECGA